MKNKIIFFGLLGLLVTLVYIILLALPDSSASGIIEIIDAKHLDTNREFISDIYEDVKELDGVWSEEIANKEYIRVIFEKKLTEKNDIAIYPRVTSGNPKVEVYEVRNDKILATFDSLDSHQSNIIYLTNLKGSQDTFDLRVLNGNIELDHIIDAPGSITDDLVLPCPSATNCDPGGQDISTEMQVQIVYTLTANDDDINFDANLQFAAGGGAGTNSINGLSGTNILNAVSDCSGDTDGWYYTTTTPTCAVTGASATCSWDNTNNLMLWDDGTGVVGETMTANWYVAPCSGADASANDPSDVGADCTKTGGTAGVSCDTYLDEIEITIPSDTINPEGYKIFLANNSFNNTLNVTFQVNATDDTNLANQTFYFWNYSTGEELYTYTQNITGLSKYVNLSYNFSIDGNYTWSVLIADASGNLNWSDNASSMDKNWTFLIDHTPPKFSPFNNITTYQNQSISYTLNATDNFVGFDTFLSNDTTRFTIYSNGTFVNITSLSIETYIVNITINDYVTNENSTLLFINVLGENTCTCAGLDTNWEIDMGDSCNIVDACNLGTGSITFIGTGTTTFNAAISTANLEYPTTGQTLFIGSSAIINVG